MSTNQLDETHDPALQSWVSSANDPATDFPIQNLPFGRFRRAPNGDLATGVAIGDQVLDLRRARLIDHDDMARVLQMSTSDRAALRLAISRGLRSGSSLEPQFRDALLPQGDVAMGLPCEIRDYTDFYVGIHHATAVGKLFRPDNPLLPNYKWVPIGYHGRASSISVSPDRFRRPRGQRPVDGDRPELLPSARLDYELELGFVIGRPNARGEPIGIESAEEHLFGVTLFNDWSARDIQAWEYQPLGPFLSKNFASTLSPWIVTLEALAPFRTPFVRAPGEHQPLPYLDSAANRAAGGLNIALEVWVQSRAMEAAGLDAQRLSASNAGDAYWTAGQLVAHHTVNGCNLSAGDLFGSGTLSGPAPGQGGSLLELTGGGKRPIELANGETRTFLEDGDTLILRGTCQRDGFRRIGFGECRGTVMPSPQIEEST